MFLYKKNYALIVFDPNSIYDNSIIGPNELCGKWEGVFIHKLPGSNLLSAQLTSRSIFVMFVFRFRQNIVRVYRPTRYSEQ